MPVKIVMPSLGMYTFKGELTRWLVEEGASVENKQQIIELTTEKTTVEVEAPATGILHRIALEGEVIAVEGLLGYILTPGEVVPSVKCEVLNDNFTPTDSTTGAQVGAFPAQPSESGRRLRVSPVARRRAKELGVNLNNVAGTGPGGRITEADVEKKVNPGKRILKQVPLTGIRRLVATKMQKSLATTAQLTLTREVDASPLLKAREEKEASVKSKDINVPIDVLIAKALALALREKPDLNAVIENNQIIILKDVHVGIAVVADDRLIVPVLQNADERPILELCKDFAGLVYRTREGDLQPDKYEGGTVTVTNLGLYNIDTFTPILNPPESAILGVGRIAPRPFATQKGELTTRQTVHLSLTFDHRVADGAAAALLLDAVIAQWPDLARH